MSQRDLEGEDHIEKFRGNTALSTTLWDVFTTDPTTAVSIFDIDGNIIYMNQTAATLALNSECSPDDLVGRNIREFGMPQEWVDERIGIYKKISERDEPAMLRALWHGHQLISWISPIQNDGEDGDKDELARLIAVTRKFSAHSENPAAMEGELEVYESTFVCLGELNSLTPRELEVLALMGQGMTMKEIARSLFRSVKTIENHRNSIGQKLEKSRGSDLANIARIAGLKIEDSTRTRLTDENRAI